MRGDATFAQRARSEPEIPGSSNRCRTTDRFSRSSRSRRHDDKVRAVEALETRAAVGEHGDGTEVLGTHARAVDHAEQDTTPALTIDSVAVGRSRQVGGKRLPLLTARRSASMRSFGMTAEQQRAPSPRKYTGPSVQRQPVYSCSMLALVRHALPEALVADFEVSHGHAGLGLRR